MLCVVLFLWEAGWGNYSAWGYLLLAPGGIFCWPPKTWTNRTNRTNRASKASVCVCGCTDAAFVLKVRQQNGPSFTLC